MIDISTLNRNQKESVLCDDKYLRIVAGAGSGKTRVLTMRIAHLIEDEGVPGYRILAITFTNKAANEMKERIRRMIPDETSQPWISTIHSLCVRILREDIQTMGWPRNFTVMDADDQKTVLKEAYKKLNIDAQRYPYGSLLDYISNNKTAEISVEYAYTLAGSFSGEKTKAQVYEYYMKRQNELLALDFDDLILWVVRMFRKYPEVLAKWQNRYRYIHVDEFQDIDQIQYTLIKQLAGTENSLYVVGDPDQTIYTWRGADVHFILDFPNKYPGCETIVLTENYRSTPEILAASNALIEKNQQRVERRLHAVNDAGPVPPYYHAKDVGAESKFIVSRLQALKEQGADWRDMAILYRAHYVSRSLEDALLHAKIPYAVYGGMEFYGRKEIKDAVCYLRMLAVGDDLAFARVVNEPRRGVGKKRMAFLRAYAQEKGCSLYGALLDNLDHPMIQSSDAAAFVTLLRAYENHEGMKMSELLSHLLTESGYMKMLKQLGDGDRLDNIAELLQSLEEYETSAGEDCTLEDFLSEVALFTDRDREDRKDSVKLMTVHNAKGLEFPHVIVASLNEGVFPSRKTDTAERMEEERRLCYVACTRAEKTLTLTEAAGVSHEGTARYPSRFLFEMGKEHLNYLVELDPAWEGEARRYIRSTQRRMAPPSDPLGPGVRVEHALFGKGTVLEVQKDQQCIVIRFDSGRERTIRFDGPIRIL